MGRSRRTVEEMPRRAQWLLVTFVLLLALAGAVLVLSVPTLFDRPEPRDLWVAGISAAVAASCAGATLALRPVRAVDPGPSDGGNGD